MSQADLLPDDSSPTALPADPIARRIPDLVTKAQELRQAFRERPLGPTGVPSPNEDDAWTYSAWYTEAQDLVSQLSPGRLAEFDRMYEPVPQPTSRQSDFGIAHWLDGISITGANKAPAFDHAAAIDIALRRQSAILMGCLVGVYSPSARAVNADELEQARLLLRQGHSRAAAVIAGVALERYLRIRAGARGLAVDGIVKASWINDQLREQRVYPQVTWRLVQTLLDIRNTAAHPNQTPDIEDVDLLITETERLVKSSSDDTT